MDYLKENNISWWTIPFAFVLALSPRIYFGILGPGSGVYDPRNPRKFGASARRSTTLNAVTTARIERSEFALNNSIENLPLFAVAVLAANTEGVDLETRNLLSILYLSIRIFYIWVYIWGQEYEWLHPLTRTMVWFCGNIVLAYLYLLPGIKHNVLEQERSYWLAEAVKPPPGYTLTEFMDNLGRHNQKSLPAPEL
ncbi:hypothetical protein F5Y00DRAFT_264177 [Daldinia vernicosa]|uniref:uncharacterized protein n=1 Tax=Daldinia vernicosa TaxID=114800 RepID=UPI0020075CAE|nr:uncharacterized protein F5Y00DRAFT_264177 [Daldinia vernicosa]KAI0846765.1 hypothetical protein F5Y00DRAFT_264177 [Daldinia vernicosa]